MARKIILRNYQSPGDILMLTAAVRDLHETFPGQYITDVRTGCPEFWENNPYITPITEGEAEATTIDCEYPLILEATERPCHFLDGFREHLSSVLKVNIRPHRFNGDIHLSEAEIDSARVFKSSVPGVPTWLIVSGGKTDFTAKWWDVERYQAVVDHFKGRIRFVQVGSDRDNHFHPRLKNVTDMVGKTDLRNLVSLMAGCDGVLCPVTMAMHLAAAVETPDGHHNRPCVVVAGGREPSNWEAYPAHQYLHTIGCLPCCATGGCWQARVDPLNDGDGHDMKLCKLPVLQPSGVNIPKCLDMISVEDVIRAIEKYLQFGSVNLDHERGMPPDVKRFVDSVRQSKTVVKFRHGLGDCVHFANLLHLYREKGHEYAVDCAPDKRFIFEAAGFEVVDLANAPNPSVAHPWNEANEIPKDGVAEYWKYNKAAVNISVDPLPDIGSAEDNWGSMTEAQYSLLPGVLVDDQEAVNDYLADLPRPYILIHGLGNTGNGGKNIPGAHLMQIYDGLLRDTDGTLILLDWDNRMPRSASYRIRHIQDTWPKLETSLLVALMAQCDLIIGVDSGPLHVARYLDLPTVGYWPNQFHYPSRYTYPRGNQVNIVGKGTSCWNAKIRHDYNIIESLGQSEYPIDPDVVVKTALVMLNTSRYLEDTYIGKDAMLQHLVSDRERGEYHHLSDIVDRDKSLDILLNNLTPLEMPIIVETGCIRANEDWGAGYMTYLVGLFLYLRGCGKLVSVDVDERNCNIAISLVKQFPNVQIVNIDSVKFLKQWSGLPGSTIDVLILDSVDTDVPGCAEHCICEVKAGAPKVSPDGLILIDDTVWNAGKWTGKGALAVPWLLENGWRILYSGYQTLLVRAY